VPVRVAPAPVRVEEDDMGRIEPLKKGMYHAIREEDGRVYRLHLRVEEDGSGVLLINAAKVVHLNRTASEYVRLFMEGVDEQSIVRYIRRHYRVKSADILSDYRGVKEAIERLATEENICPVSFMGFERMEPLSRTPSAPYRMDFALTYECNNDCVHCYVEEGRKKESMSLERWKDAIRKCWDVGVPHICFTGGEPTVVDFLPELVEFAEDKGIVTGLLTNGRRLADEKFCEKLVAAGLDHIQITIESADEAVHDEMVGVKGAHRETVAGLKNALKADLYTITNTTLTRLNVERIEETVRFLSGCGLSVVAMNGLIHTGRGKESGIGLAEGELEGVLERVLSVVQDEGMRLVWYTPTRYCVFDPISLGLGIKQCTAARYNMCVEPDGALLPCQSFYEVVGSFIDDEWEELWNAPLCRRLREREWVDEKCRSCERLAECGGGCPLYERADVLFCHDAASATAV